MSDDKTNEAGWIAQLEHAVENELTDKAIEAVLWLMKRKFDKDEEYRKCIAGFNGVCVIRSGKEYEHIAATAIFQNGEMRIDTNAAKKWNVRITFVNCDALRGFLISGGKNILDLALQNSAQVQGNYNYFYRVGFLTREYLRRSPLSIFLPS